MRNIILYTSFFCFISSSSWGQQKKTVADKKEVVASKTPDSIANETKVRKRVKYYHVEEIVPLRFGGHTTTYDVSDFKKINTYDLGPNNKRIITTVYADELVQEAVTLKADTLKKIQGATLTISDQAKHKDQYAYIDIIKTYERVSDKGFNSVDMLKKVGDSYFFNDELEKAEECYTKLFGLTTDLEPQYYYRYSIALRAKGKTELAEQYLKKFNELSNKLPSK